MESAGTYTAIFKSAWKAVKRIRNPTIRVFGFCILLRDETSISQEGKMKSRRRRALVSLAVTCLLLLGTGTSRVLLKTQYGRVTAGWYAWQRACNDHGYVSSVAGIFATAGVGAIFGGPAGFAASLIVGL